MIKNIFIILTLVVIALIFFHHPKAHWQGQLAPADPYQTSDNLPAPWVYKDFTVTPRAKYHIKAVVLSSHHYWGEVEVEDTIAYYDLALGWGPMSDASIINQLNIWQFGRWYYYNWHGDPPINPVDIASHSSNHHLIAANQDVLEVVAHFKPYDVIEMEGYLVDVKKNDSNWQWRTSLSRFDTGGGACKLLWVTSAFTD